MGKSLPALKNPCVRCKTAEAQYPGGMCIWCDTETTVIIATRIRLNNDITPEARAYRELAGRCEQLEKENAELKRKIEDLLTPD